MKKYRILAIDDEPDILSLLEGVLGEEYEIVTMNNPLKAIENLEEIEADIFIVDVMMPEMGGRDVVRQIRLNPLYKQSPVIFLSVITDRRVIIETFQCGGDLYLTKPFIPKRFLDSVRSLMSRRVFPSRQKKWKINELRESLSKPKTEKPKTVPPIATAPKSASEEITKIMTPAPPAKPRPVSVSTPYPHSVKTPSPADEEITKELTPAENISISDLPTPPPVDSTPETKPHTQERKICHLPRILLADDDQEIIEILTISLGDKYELFSVINGYEAVRQAETIEPDIFVLDAMMPRITGYQVCQVLKRSEHFANTPIIIISAKASPKDVEYIKKLGVKAFIPKPFNYMQMDNAIVKIIKEPYFEIKPKLYTREELLEMKDMEAFLKQEKDRDRLHRETRSKMRDFIQQHEKPL